LGQVLQDVSRPEDIAGADKLIFPGVGHAGPAMAFLRQSGIDKAIRNYNKPLLGICLGMQLMGSHSEEGNTSGLAVFPEKVKRFAPGVKIPHMGWNQINNPTGVLFTDIPAGTHFYFIHSYFMETGTHTVATCHYQQAFSAAAACENFFGVQFHPEKSGEAGMQVLKNFLSI
jgi:imidazole glycerol-phosphate synthase subunit HisH